MNFVSYSFLVLLLVALAGRFVLGRRKVESPYVWLLLVLSLVFYGWHVPAYLGILLFSALVDYWAGLALARLPAPADASPRELTRRRAILVASLGTNLGLLGFFKYANFGIESVAAVLTAMGAPPGWERFDVLLPMGISFYTFQSMSYTIDIYRGQLAPLHRVRDFLLFIAFFPQLVAGPIVRASEFLPQMRRIRWPRLQVVNEGLFLIVSGFFLKVVCADNLADYVDANWARGYEPGADAGLLVALALMFSGQIFADFAGYSNIARGTALLLGFRLPLNFNAPYLAASFKNFWERWHMTLSRWLRDYLYVSLGGNRVSARRTYVNLLLTMLLGGLWHGAAWTFVVWGALHGTALAVERALGLERPTHGARGVAARAGWFVVVQAVVLLTWIVFRSDTLAGALQFAGNIVGGADGPIPAGVLEGLVFAVPVLLHHLWRWAEERGRVPVLAPQGKAVLVGSMIVGLALGYGSSNDFIYFQF